MNVSNCPVDGAAVQSGDGDDTDATIDYAQQDSNIDYGAGKSSDSDFASSDDEPLSKFAGKKTSNRDVDQVGKLPRG